MASGSGWNLRVWLAGGGCGWNLWVWLVGVVVRRYIDFLIFPTPLVSALFCSLLLLLENATALGEQRQVLHRRFRIAQLH